MRNVYYQLLNYMNTSQTEDVFYYAAKTVLEHLPEIPSLSITQVADMCFASTATISRLIRRLNYPSFNEFKQDVIYSLDEMHHESPLHFENEPVRNFSNVSPKQLKDEFYQSIALNLEYTQKHVSEKDIAKVVDYIDQAKRVIILGYNFSQNVSFQLQQTLALFNKEVVSKANERLQLSILEETTKDDLIILTTITGNFFKYKKEATDLIMKSPAKKIVITQAMDLTPEGLADKIIPVGNKNVSYIGKFSVMMIFELIEMFYSARHIHELENI